jgi:hypothetical protein
MIEKLGPAANSQKPQDQALSGSESNDFRVDCVVIDPPAISTAKLSRMFPAGYLQPYR